LQQEIQSYGNQAGKHRDADGHPHGGVGTPVHAGLRRLRRLNGGHAQIQKRSPQLAPSGCFDLIDQAHGVDLGSHRNQDFVLGGCVGSPQGR